MKSKYRNAVIIGASSGIGRALAEEYASCGTALCLLSISENAACKLAEDLTSKGAKCFFRKCDVTIKEDIKNGLKYAAEVLGTIDLVIINSGAGGPNWMDSFSSNDFIKLFEVNTFSIAHVLEYIIPFMKEQGYGTIAGITSLADVRGYSGSSGYSASKAAASVLLEAARVELRKEKIRVITVRPGFVKTAMTDKNEFYMPFLMQPAKAAAIIRKGIEKGRSIVQFPFFTVNITRLVKFIPNWIYDFAMSSARPKN